MQKLFVSFAINKSRENWYKNSMKINYRYDPDLEMALTVSREARHLYLGVSNWSVLDADDSNPSVLSVQIWHTSDAQSDPRTFEIILHSNNNISKYQITVVASRTVH
jgi:hypothetical protein